MQTNNKYIRNNQVWRLILLTLTLSWLTLSCKDDEENDLPSYLVNLVEASTDSNAMITLIRLDDGNTYNVSQNVKAQHPDTTYRCICTYSIQESNIVLYELSHVFSDHPRSATSFKSHPVDPVKFISSWMSDRYFNLRIGIMTTDTDTHLFAFCEDSIVVESTCKKVYFSLLHQRPDNDAESYTKELFLSMPTAGYSDCDSLIFHINTYDGLMRITK